ncbi:hypothetical protein [Flagellimonas meishanensis]|uniref:hypothetical protein n=1 Tax=Flagellimonas meishanensis TaxID=2873264 RepID=UPI001CA65A4F|nr:hypothetical protein [[Muricauda] meishanensis]
MQRIGVPYVGLVFLYLLNPYGLHIYLGYLLIGLLILKKDFLTRNLDTIFLVLLLFSITFAAFFSFEPKAGKQYILVYALVPSALYLMGKYFAEKLEGNRNHLFFLLLFAGCLFAVTPILSVFFDILRNGYGVVDRNLPSFWTGQVILATIMGSHFAIVMTIPGLLIPKVKNLRLIYRLALLGIFAISVACVLRIGSRTQLSIFFITFLTALIYVMPRQSFRRNLFMFMMFFLLVFYAINTISFDLDQDWLSAFANRMEDGQDFASGGGRTDRWMKSLENLFEKPLGWSEHEFGHSHNLWFDVLRVGGFLSFFLLIFFTTSSYISVFKSVIKNKKAYALNNQIIIYTLAFTMVFMVEPIMEGMFNLFAFFCFFVGVVKKYGADNPVIE